MDWAQIGFQLVGMAAMAGVSYGALRGSVSSLHAKLDELKADVKDDISAAKGDLGREIGAVRDTAGAAHERIDRHLETHRRVMNGS